jgi:hypothetical protein
MNKPEDYENEERQFSISNFIRWGLIVFTTVIYLYIFAKTVFIE